MPKGEKPSRAAGEIHKGSWQPPKYEQCCRDIRAKKGDQLHPCCHPCLWAPSFQLKSPTQPRDWLWATGREDRQ